MKELAEDLKKWMTREQTDPELANLIYKYINHHGELQCYRVCHLSNQNTKRQQFFTIYLDGAISWKDGYR